MIGVVQCVLSDVSIGPLQTGSDSLWRLIGEFEGHLQQANWELQVFFCCNPKSEVGMDLFSVNNCLHDLITEM